MNHDRGKNQGWILAALATTVFALGGCETSSHRSVNTFEYDGAPRSSQQPSTARLQSHEPPEESERDVEPEEDEGEWHMVSPGEMAAPGKPVVDPSRKTP